ncbi:MAG: purine-binding chemotaxis protein CheW [Deltaproteobacteria bacterium]|nr:purine-binding chemotaxis protein CheW [Deltaproteobacteria bacterium]
MPDEIFTTSSENEVTLGCFEVGGRLIAIDVANIREVVRWQPVTPLPKSPALIDGVIDLRGTLVPVVDLARALDESKVEPTTGTRIVVAETDGLVVGLTVDSAVEVRRPSPPKRATTQPGPWFEDLIRNRSWFCRWNPCSRLFIARY